MTKNNTYSWFINLLTFKKLLILSVLFVSVFSVMTIVTKTVGAADTWTARDSVRSWGKVTSSSDGTKLAALDSAGYIYTSTNGGTTWTQRGIAKNWTSITSSSDGSKLAATAWTGHIYTSTDSGATWTQKTTGTTRAWRAITSSSDGMRLAAVVGGGYIYTSTNGGTTWSTSTAAGSLQWNAITSDSTGLKLAAVSVGSSLGTPGYIFTSTDGGISWARRTSDVGRVWNSITSDSSGTKLAAVVNNGYIYTSKDSGTTWSTSTASGVKNWISITSSADGTKLAAAAINSHIYTSTDGGATWTQSTTGIARVWSAVASDSTGTKLVGTEKNGYIYTNTGSVVPPPVSIAPTTVSFTATSPYILKLSQKEDTMALSGFGVSYVADTCTSSLKAMGDSAKISNLLKAQVSSLMTEYFAESCNKAVNSASDSCVTKIDAINNVLLTYATYKIADRANRIDYPNMCNTSTNQPNGGTRINWIDVDFAAMAYASVRDALMTTNYGKYGTSNTLTPELLLGQVDSKMIAAFSSAAASKYYYRDAKRITVLKTLRDIAKTSFATEFKISFSAATAGSITTPVTLSTATAFYIFGLTNNVSDKTIGSIAFNSAQEYMNFFNADKARFGDLYSAQNKPLRSVSEAILLQDISNAVKIMDSVRSLPNPLAVATTSAVAQSTNSQTANVFYAIGDWFKGIWNWILSLFGTKEVGAATTPTDLASGSNTLCPGLTYAKPAPKINLIADNSPHVANRGFYVYPAGSVYKNSIVRLENIYTTNSTIDETVLSYKHTVSKDRAVLTKDEYKFLRDWFYVEMNTAGTDGRELPTRFEIQKLTNAQIDKKVLYNFFQPGNRLLGDIAEGQKVKPLSEPNNPYNCLRYVDGWMFGFVEYAFYPKSINATYTALEQTASAALDTKQFRTSVIESNGAMIEKAANDIAVMFFNRNKGK